MGRKVKIRELNIWMNGEKVARWVIDSTGEHQLFYDEHWLTSSYVRPLSLSLPLQNPDNPHRGIIVESYFDNLLPDSIDIRKRIQSRFGIPKASPFDLLEEIGKDCIGAVQLLSPDKKPDNIFKIEGNPLSEAEIEQKLINVTSHKRVSINNADECRISIAGVQEKTAFLYQDGIWKQPFGTTPTTHIFKLPLGFINNMDMQASIENEWLCSEIIRKFGLPVSEGSITNFGKQKVLVVKRFDRKYSDNNSWIIRLPQEDMCQATGTSPGLKYESDGGPGMKSIMDLLLGSKNMISDRLLFFKTQILFWVLAASDGHAKNFSIFIEPKGGYSLTPLYDVISAYPVVGNSTGKISLQKVKMAMSVKGRNKHYKWINITKRHWLDTGRAVGLSSAAVKEIIEEIIDNTPTVISAVENMVTVDFPVYVAESIFAGIKKGVEILGRSD